MARERPLAEDPCPIARAIDVLGDRWTLHILKHANVGLTRFDQFRTELGIADNILSSRLSLLVAKGLLVRVPYTGSGRTRHEYRLTPSGADLLPVLHTLAAWGQTHTEPAEPAGRIEFVHASCQTPIAGERFCPSCEVDVPREEEAWVRPWRSARLTPVAAPYAADSVA